MAGAGWRLTGASDHLVSEALYLRDPEGNGIEIYRDRPREEWRRDGDELAMATLPLDLESVLGELEPGERPGDGMPAGTTMGHVHLQVADIPAGRGLLQRRARARRDGALLSRARSSWPPAATTTTSGSTPGRARARPPPPEGALGLDRYELVLPSAAERDSAADRLAQAGRRPAARDEGVLATDPSGNRVLLTARDSRLARGEQEAHQRVELACVHPGAEVGGHRAEASVARRAR